jgi:hypothetical protein
MFEDCKTLLQPFQRAGFAPFRGPLVEGNTLQSGMLSLKLVLNALDQLIKVCAHSHSPSIPVTFGERDSSPRSRVIFLHLAATRDKCIVRSPALSERFPDVAVGASLI